MANADPKDEGLPFPSTHASRIGRACRPEAKDYNEAWEYLFTSYWKPLWIYLRRKGRGEEEAEEILTVFFEQRIDGQILSTWDPTRLRFRQFLLADLKDLMIDEWRKKRTMRKHFPWTLGAMSDEDRRGIDEVLRDPRTPDPEQEYELQWAATVLERSLRVLAAKLKDSDQDSDRISYVLLTERLFPDHDPRTVEDLSKSLGIEEDDVYQRISRLYDAIREEVVWQVREYSPDAAEEGDEANEILRCLFPDEPRWRPGGADDESKEE